MNRSLHWPYYLSSAVCVAFIVAALHFWGAADIRSDPGELMMLTVIGMIWLWFSTRLFAWLGLSLTGDVIEQHNVGALLALCGAILAMGLIYAGGNVGEGPSYSNNVFSVTVGTIGFLALWILFEIAGGVSISITEDRDIAAGIRLGGFLLAIGMMFGRAIAGDWVSEVGTIRDFVHDSWPANIIWALALGVERLAKPGTKSPTRPWLTFGLLPALAYVALAAAWLLHIGPWEGMRR